MSYSSFNNVIAVNSGEDYEYTSREVSLVGNQSIAIVNIPIINDDLAEGAETFGGVLEVTSQSLNLSSVSTIQIEIIDNEGKQCEMVGISTAVCFFDVTSRSIC